MATNKKDETSPTPDGPATKPTAEGSKKDEPSFGARPTGSPVGEPKAATEEAKTPVRAVEHKDEPAKALDETLPGGVYLHTDGKTFINANGQPIDKTGKILDENPLPRG